ncbi:5-histidylcysteine sulfoxide synthase [uncultured Draconibacterium sp.]|uniref:5-histidylcysteine sulfoxide synthase n=1 Tax=uncultured Draconibacterium sp. TaxID=1573823 RepID=UPI0032179E97
MNQLVTHTIDLINGDLSAKKAEIHAYFLNTFELDEKLYEYLKGDEPFYRRADSLRHPLIFYYGHTAVFYINKLILAKLIDSRVDPHFESVFAIGVDEMSWDDLNEQHYQWPAVSEVMAYRQKVKSVVLSVIENTTTDLPITPDHPLWIIMMGIEHERIHIETSSVLIRQLPLDNVIPDVFGKRCFEIGEAPANRFLPVKETEIVLGKPENHRHYGWDLEYGTNPEKVPSFNASKYLISNKEFVEFVNDRGYFTKEYWTDEGWNWKEYKKAEHPLFWRKQNNDYFLRLFDQEIQMPWNWPVEVNYLEANAFANWKSKKTGKSLRLPTEAEWYSLAGQNGISDDNFAAVEGNINLAAYISPCPVDTFKQGGFYDIIGNVWQWTETPVTGFPGFKVHPLYDDFSTPTFDGKHNLIKGGSWISTGNEATWYARYAFRRHFYQHAGFRLVESDAVLQIRNDEYETDEEVAQSCEFNFGVTPLGFDNFQKKLAEICIKYADGRSGLKMLDLNCDTGRTVFEVATHFQHVTGIDFSARFIRMAIQLQEKGFIRYITKDEGELLHYNDIQLSKLGITKVENTQFMQADANNLKPIYTGYDLILAVNLLEELYAPDRFLASINERLNAGGILILGSTYNWEKNNIKREHWPGGFKKDGEPVRSFEGIKALLQDKFELVEQPFNLNAAQRSSTRSIEVSLVELSVWRKK